MNHRVGSPAGRVAVLACAFAVLLGCAHTLEVRAAAASPGPIAAAGFSFVKSFGGIDEYHLDSNGLTVLLVSDHSAPVVTFHLQGPSQLGRRTLVLRRGRVVARTHTTVETAF